LSGVVGVVAVVGAGAGAGASVGAEGQRRRRRVRRASDVWVESACGALAGGVARTTVSPLDVAKIRLQAQRESLRTGKYRGMVHLLATVAREEGAAGLFRGTVPALLFWIPYTGIQFAALGAFERAAERAGVAASWDPTALAFLGGAVAGVAATVASYPFDLMRTTMAAQGTPPVYRTLAEGVRGVWRRSGPSGFYVGLGTTVLEIIPGSAVQFGVYAGLKRAIADAKPAPRSGMASRGGSGRDGGEEGEARGELGAHEKFVCGLLAGSVSKVAVHPLDVAKKRIQIQGLVRAERMGRSVAQGEYARGLLDCLRRILAAEGVEGLYKGLAPSLLKAAPATAVTFVVYEALVRALLPPAGDGSGP